MAKSRITLIGCGFTGTVLGHAIKAAMPEVEVIGHDKDQSIGKRAESAKAIDKHHWNLPAAAEKAALVILCIPSDGVETTLKTIASDLSPGAIILDLSGQALQGHELAKRHVPDDVVYASSRLVFHPDLVPVGTPVTGAKAEMLRGAMWPLAPRTGTTPDASDAIAGFVAQLGAAPLFMDPAELDGLSMSVDMLPNLLGSALMLAVSKDGAWRDRQWMAGATFGEITESVQRATALPKALLMQKTAAVHWLNQTMLQLMVMRDAISDDDLTTLENLLNQANEQRERWLADWRKGRDDGRGPAYKPPSMLGSLLGQGFAQRLTERGKKK